MLCIEEQQIAFSMQKHISCISRRHKRALNAEAKWCHHEDCRPSAFGALKRFDEQKLVRSEKLREMDLVCGQTECL